MLQYWIQNGEANYNDNINKDFIKDSLSNIFGKDGNHTAFSFAYFKQLNNKNMGASKDTSFLDAFSNYIYKTLNEKPTNKSCSICNTNGSFELKGWIYPFIISKDKFPNLYPNGKIEYLNVCKSCAYKSILAYKYIKFYFNGDNLSWILFFSDNASSLKRFINSAGGEKVMGAEYYTNVEKNIIKDIIYYPYELLANLLYNISTKIEDYSHYNLGAIVVGLTTGSKKIYSNGEIVNDLNPIINTFKELYNENDKAFIPLFIGLRGFTNSEDLHLKRNTFFKSIIVNKSINWSILEDILFHSIENNSSIPFIYDFLEIIMRELNLSERELFEEVSKEGWKIGNELKSINNYEISKIKPMLYELRRKRKLEEFLDAINHLQLSIEKQFNDKPFKEHPERFVKLKTFFLIGMTNAIFTKGGNDNEK